MFFRYRTWQWNPEWSKVTKWAGGLGGRDLEKDKKRRAPDGLVFTGWAGVACWLCWQCPQWVTPLSFSLQLDHILSPPPMPFRKCSNPDVTSVPAKSLKFKRQLSEDGRELRRGSLGGALTGESWGADVIEEDPHGPTSRCWQVRESHVWKPACFRVGPPLCRLFGKSWSNPDSSKMEDCRNEVSYWNKIYIQ